MRKLRPELLNCLKHYSSRDFVRDLTAGIIVAIIALPLSIALALASGVSPEQGLYTAIVGGFVLSALGGSKVQIAGPTAAFATIVAGVVARSGMEGLAAATLLAGLFLIVMGLLHLGSLIRFIPYTITTGFTAGIAITIAIGQIKDFLGLQFQNSPIGTMDKLQEVISTIGTLSVPALLVGCFSLAILIFWPKLSKKIPASLVAVIASALLVKLASLPVNTIGDLYTISNTPPQFHMPVLHLDTIASVIPDAFTIAILAAIESLLSAVVADDMIGSKHNSNMELVAQGAANAASALFGGIPATGAIARTAANIKNGGRSPVAGMVHAVVLLLFLVLLMPYAALIPMPCIAAILFQVAYNMSGWRAVAKELKKAPKSDIAVLVLTIALTVIYDLVVAIGVGLVLACLLFMKRMADEFHVRECVAKDYNVVPTPWVKVVEITGPMFFGAADKISDVEPENGETALVLDMKGVPSVDISALNSMEHLLWECQGKGVQLILVHVGSQPMHALKKSGLEPFILPDMPAALKYLDVKPAQ